MVACCVGVDLSSRDAAVQVFSALLSLTTVFGMGTGGPSTSSTPTKNASAFFECSVIIIPVLLFVKVFLIIF